MGMVYSLHGVPSSWKRTYVTVTNECSRLHIMVLTILFLRALRILAPCGTRRTNPMGDFLCVLKSYLRGKLS